MTDPRSRLEEMRVARHSPLYQWLYRNRYGLAPLLNGPRPPWTDTAMLAAEDGITGRQDGAPLSKQAVMAAWHRLMRDLANTASVSDLPGPPPAIEPRTQDRRPWATRLKPGSDMGQAGGELPAVRPKQR